jgi:hypothetical protein
MFRSIRSVCSDGAIVEGANISASGFIGGGQGREQADLSPTTSFSRAGA